MSGIDAAARALAFQARATPQLLSRRVAMLGDSFHAPPDAVNGGYGYILTPLVNPTLVQRRNTSMMNWLQVFSGQQFEHGLAQNKAIAGQYTTQMLARFDSDIAPLKAGILVYCAGTNDIQNGVLPDTTIANDLAIIAKARALGMRVFLGTIAPRNAWSDSPSTATQNYRRRCIRNVNARRHVLARVIPGVTIVDFQAAWGDPTSNIGSPYLVYVQADGLHPSNDAGGFWLGWMLWKAFQAAGFSYLAPPRNDGLDPVTVGIVAADNPWCNRLPNPTLQGTTGTVLTATGTAPASWTLSRSAGTTGACVGSQVARPDGLPGTAQQLVVTASGGSLNEQYQLQPAAAIAVVPGETWEARCGIGVAAPVGFRGAQLRLQFFAADGATVLLETWCFDSTGKHPDGVAWSGLLRTEPWVVPATAATAKLYIRFTVDGTAAGTTATVTATDAFVGRVPLASEMGL